MVEEGTKEKQNIVRRVKSLKDVNRDLRTKLTNINKTLLTQGNKEKKGQSLKSSKTPSLVIKPRTKKLATVSAHTPQRSPVQNQKKESESKKSKPKAKIEKDKKRRDNAALSSPQQKVMVEKKTKEQLQEELSLSSLSSSDSNSKEKKSSTDKQTPTKKKKEQKFYTQKQLKKMIDKLYKQINILRADDPAVEELLKETRESIKAIEELEKIYRHVHEESKTRTKRLVDDFDRLKNLRQQHSRDLDTQIAQQVRAEVDCRKELEEILNDDNVKNLMTKPLPSKEEAEQQPSFIVNMLKSIFGL